MLHSWVNLVKIVHDVIGAMQICQDIKVKYLFSGGWAGSLFHGIEQIAEP